jgi:hypothetical protein
MFKIGWKFHSIILIRRRVELSSFDTGLTLKTSILLILKLLSLSFSVGSQFAEFQMEKDALSLTPSPRKMEV